MDANVADPFYLKTFLFDKYCSQSWADSLFRLTHGYCLDISIIRSDGQPMFVIIMHSF